MSGTPAEQAPTLAVGALPAASEPSDLAVAIRVGQYILTTYGHAGHEDVFVLNQAYGAVREALRIMLRAVGAEPAEPVPSAVAELHRLCRDDYTSNAARRAQNHRDDTHLIEDARCPAAHHDDPTPCTGPPVVTVLDAQSAGADGCEHHGTRLLASLEGGRVYPLPDAPEGAAIRVFKAADTTRPFAWHEGAPRTRPDQLSRAENRRAGEDR